MMARGCTNYTRRLVALGLGINAICFALGMRFSFTIERHFWWVQSTGYTALIAFLSCLTTSPLRKLSVRYKMKLIYHYCTSDLRRSLGITSAVLACVHAIVVSTVYYSDSLWFQPLLEPFSKYGILCFLLLSILWVTSFPKFVRGVNLKHWKQLHWLTYLGWVLLFFHIALAPSSSIKLTIALFSLPLFFRIIEILRPNKRQTMNGHS